jgi:hypothetical protein
LRKDWNSVPLDPDHSIRPRTAHRRGHQAKLKKPTGRFAAGGEVVLASVLSDGGFRLYIRLCLNADRSRGRLRVRSLQTSPRFCGAVGDQLSRTWKNCAAQRLRDPVRRGQARGRQIEICDTFWPYRRTASVQGLKRRSQLHRAGAPVVLRPAAVWRANSRQQDQKLGGWLFGSELVSIETGLPLECARKYVAMVNGKIRGPIAGEDAR